MKSTAGLMNGEDVLKILSEQAPVGACVMRDGRFCYVNSFFASATGYTADELIGSDSLEIVVPEDREMTRENTLRMLKGELLSPYQFRVTCKDNRIIWVMATVKSIQYRGRRATLGNYMEITERRLMEQAVRESEEKYRELANSISDVFFAMDEHLRYTYWNRASEALTGIRAEDAAGKSLSEIFPDKPWRRRAEEVYRSVLRTQQPQTFVNDYDIDGRHYVLEINAYPSLGGVSVLVKDITEHRQAEDARREAQNEKSALLEEAPVSIVHTDLKGEITYVNRRFESESGYSRREVIGKSGFQLDWFHADTLEFLAQRMTARLGGSPAKHWETQFRCKDGRLIWIELEGKILKRSEVPAGFQIIATNITERKQAEEALRRSEERYRTILEETGDGYFEADLDGNFTFVNDAQARLLGYSTEELVGRNFRAFTPEESVTAILEAYNHVYKTGEPLIDFPSEVIRSDGSHGFAETSAFPTRDDKGEIIGFRGVRRDITERRQAQQALRESEERYRALFDRSLDCVYIHDFEGNFLDANEAALELFGYERKDIPALNFASLLSEDQLPKALATLQELRDTGTQTQVNEFRVKRKDGSSMDVETIAAVIYHNGRPYAIQGIGRNVTESNRVREALEKSEERYRTLAENAGEAIFVIQDDVVRFINPKGMELSGYSREELASRPFAKFIYPDDISMVADRYLKRLRGEPVPQTYDFRIIRKDGDIRWGELNAVPVSWEDRPAVLCFMSDITERKQAVEALRQSEERYRTILDEMEDAYFEVDLGGHLTFVNDSVCRDLGYSRQELTGKSYKALMVEDDIESVFRVFNEVYRTGVPNKGFPWRTVCKDGSHGFAETSITLLRNAQGETIGFRGVGRDITERKRAEEKLRESEENYRALFDSAVIGIIVRDAETMKIVMVNHAAAKMFGFSSVEEALEADPFDFVPPEDKERYTELARKAMFGETSHEPYEIRAMTRDGREKWIDVTATTIMHKGRLASLISFIDITEQKRQSERLVMTDRLASIGELAAGAAHELNNPLTSITGFSQLLMERELPDDIRADLKLINKEAQRAASVTTSLLTFARRRAPVREPSQLNDIIEDIVRLRAHEHKVNCIEVKKRLASDLPTIMVDYYQMQQVFLNIIINAGYSMTEAHRKGTLTITTRKQNAHVTVSFADDGPGIAPENLSRIFDPFFTTKEAGKGTGLGLSICHGIVAAHGGQIYARSQPGQGAIIFVELPINGSKDAEVIL